jgi:hypothetical protein
VCRSSLGGIIVVVALVTSGHVNARGGTYHHSDFVPLVTDKPTPVVRHPHHEPSHRSAPIRQQNFPTTGGRQ